MATLMCTKARPVTLLTAALLAGLLLCLALVGCSLAQRTDDGPIAEVEEGVQVPGRVQGGTLRLMGSLPPTLDPALAQDATSAEYIVHLYSGLVRLDAELEVIPDLAARWELSEDGRTYTFHLLEGLAFADGRPLTAYDVVYSIERACSPDLGSPVAASYLGDIVGVADYAAGRGETITGLRAIAPDVVEITIDAPKAYFLAKLTYPVAFVVDREQISREGPGWVRRPNGSGPFVLESLSRERIVLVRNENYHRRLPALERVEYLIEGGSPVTMYENDELDVVDVPPSEMERMTDPENPLHDELRVASELSVTYIGLNVAMPPFDDVAVRQALAQAIDRDKIAELVLQGTGTAAHSILPPGMPDHDPSLVVHPYDPQSARELLASSRYGAQGEAMPELVLAISGTSGHMDSLTEAILSMLHEHLGLQMVVHQVEWSDFLRDLQERRYPMFLAGWIADYADSENFLDLLFHSQSPQNHTGYANAVVDGLLEEARVEVDEERRTALYRQAERIIVEEAPWVPLVHGLQWKLVKPYVQGFASTSAIQPWLLDVYIDHHGND